jgi:hypothetical protein
MKNNSRKATRQDLKKAKMISKVIFCLVLAFMVGFILWTGPGHKLALAIIAGLIVFLFSMVIPWEKPWDK